MGSCAFIWEGVVMKQNLFSIFMFFVGITVFLADIEAVDKKYIKIRGVQSRKKEHSSRYFTRSVAGLLKHQREQFAKMASLVQAVTDAQYSCNTQCARILKTQQEQAKDLAAQWRKLHEAEEQIELFERSNNLVSFIEKNLIDRLIAKGLISPEVTLDRMRSSSISSSEKSSATSPSTAILERSSSSDDDALRHVRALSDSASPRERCAGAQLNTSPFSEEDRSLKDCQDRVEQLLKANSPTGS